MSILQFDDPSHLSTPDIFRSVASETAKLLKEGSINIGSGAIKELLYKAISTISGHDGPLAGGIGLPGVGLGALAGGNIGEN